MQAVVPPKRVILRDGLAVYAVGAGEPILLLPYPHGYTAAPMAEGLLASQLVRLGRRVITFDPPGAYRSTRQARVDMPEMLENAQEALDAYHLPGTLDVIGHSMGSFCALALALEYPAVVKRLILVGGLSGAPVIRRYGVPRCWHWTDLDFWRCMLWGFRLMRGGGNLALHKRHKRLIDGVSYLDKNKAPIITIEPGDERRAAPIRDRWAAAVVLRNLDYSRRLGEIRAPTLIGVGRFDPQTPVPCSQELADGIARSRLVIFEHSGHSPFVEEPDAFLREIDMFLC